MKLKKTFKKIRLNKPVLQELDEHMEMIKRLLALPMNKRTHFLRVKTPLFVNGEMSKVLGSHL